MTAPAARPPSTVDQVAAAWGPDVPDWVMALADHVARWGQKRTAERLSLSRATVSLLLNKKYKASTAALEQRIRGVLLAEAVACPVLGDLPRDRCADHQRAPRPVNGDPIAARLYTACRDTCPHSRLAKRS